MKKIIKLIIHIFLFFSLFSLPSYAVDDPVTLKSPISIENVGQLINRVSGVVVPLSITAFIFTIIYAGFIRMTAVGNPEKESKSMKVAIGAAIGFAVIALAPLIVRVIVNLIGIETDVVT